VAGRVGLDVNRGDDMADEQQGSDEIKETDIVFDCPFCNKSLAIDYRGAGLTIPCTDCGRLVEVPIPEGMELSDLDSSVEEQEIRIVHMRKSLAAAQARIQQLEEEVAGLRGERTELTESRTTNIYKLGTISEHAEELEVALKKATGAAEEILRQIARESAEQSQTAADA